MSVVIVVSGSGVGSGFGLVIENISKSETVSSIVGSGVCVLEKGINSSVIVGPMLANRLSGMLLPVAGSVIVLWSDVLDCSGFLGSR